MTVGVTIWKTKEKRMSFLYLFFSFFEKHMLYVLSIVFFWYLPYDRIKPAATSLYGSMWDWTVTFVIEHKSEHPTNAHPGSFFASKRSRFFFGHGRKNQGENWEKFHLIRESLICQTHWTLGSRTSNQTDLKPCSKCCGTSVWLSSVCQLVWSLWQICMVTLIMQWTFWSAPSWSTRWSMLGVDPRWMWMVDDGWPKGSSLEGLCFGGDYLTFSLEKSRRWYYPENAGAICCRCHFHLVHISQETHRWIGGDATLVQTGDIAEAWIILGLLRSRCA